MNKKEFLDKLEQELTKLKHNDIKSVLDYYDELIEDKKEAKEKEKDIIKKLGTIEDIIKNIKVEQKLEIAKEKPTVSNNFKALIAFLGILSLPFLIPLIIVIGSLGLVIIVLFFSLLLVLGSLILSIVVVIIGLIVNLFLGKLSFATFIFSLGIMLILAVFLKELCKWLIKVGKNSQQWFIENLNNKILKRKEVRENE